MVVLLHIFYRLGFLSTDIPSVDIIEEHIAVIGQSVTITADIESCPPVKSVIWEKRIFRTEEFQRIDITDSDKYSGSNFDHRHSQLVIKNAAIKDGLRYRLTVSNGLGETQSRTVVLKLKGGMIYTFTNNGH